MTLERTVTLRQPTVLRAPAQIRRRLKKFSSFSQAGVANVEFIEGPLFECGGFAVKAADAESSDAGAR